MAEQPQEPGAPPTAAQIVTLLGRAAPLWEELQTELTEAYGPLGRKWSFSGKSGRWSLQLKAERKKRTIVYAIPCPKHFIAAFALGEKACLAARSGGLPEQVLDIIDRAPRYPEGRGVWLEVRTKRELLAVVKVASLKMTT